jgi:hypothetical protein
MKTLGKSALRSTSASEFSSFGWRAEHGTRNEKLYRRYENWVSVFRDGSSGFWSCRDADDKWYFVIDPTRASEHVKPYFVYLDILLRLKSATDGGRVHWELGNP